MPVYRFIPSLPVEVRQGAVVQAARRRRQGRTRASRPRRLARRARRVLFAELGTLVVLDDALVDVAMGLMSCAPAYVALVAEAQIDAGVRKGIPAAQGAELVVQTLAGTAELLRRATTTRSPCAARSPRPAGSPRAGSTRSSARACAPPSATRSTPCCEPAAAER